MEQTLPRILVVDDDAAVLQTYVRALVELAPVSANDGVAAQAILSSSHVDVVVCDLEMPGLNGLDLMRWAKEHRPHALWIVVSGQGTLEAAIQALKLGAFDFICKPLQSTVQLQTVVANALRQQALVAERALLLASLADNNIRLGAANHNLEIANRALHDQQATIDRDLERADQIVRALLPRALPPIANMQVNVAYRPQKSIGGDLYGAVMLDDRHLGIYVADAAGHGISAALLAVLLNQHLLLIKAETGVRAPAAILCDLNRALLDECRASSLFITAVYAVLDTKERTATIASAGHPPVLLLRETGTIEHFEKTGPALGLAPDAVYTEHHVSLEEGDRLLLYTDGMTAAIAEHAPSLDAIAAAGAAHAEDGGKVIDGLLAWTERPGPHPDDLTLMLVTAAPGASQMDALQPTPRATAPHDSSLSIGSDDRTTWIAIRGHSTWKDAALLRDTCIRALDAGRDVVVDLAACLMLDSTILGTLHEVAVRAEPRQALKLQGVAAELRALFVELAMTQVMATITSVSRPPPAACRETRTQSNAEASGLILHAHELLAQLSASNSAQFRPLIDELKR